MTSILVAMRYCCNTKYTNKKINEPKRLSQNKIGYWPTTTKTSTMAMTVSWNKKTATLSTYAATSSTSKK